VFDRLAINTDNIVDYIADIFSRRGAESYMGEDVSMSQHMLQAAQAAEDEGADADLVVAALLHDIGHFSSEFSDTELMQGTDNYHEEAGASFLAKFFPPSVTEPVRQHVAAKRYLCSVNPDYMSSLSEASKYTLNVQGGPMTDAEVRAFEQNPYLERCIKVRIWDDRGKDPARSATEFSHFHELVESLVVRQESN